MIRFLRKFSMLAATGIALLAIGGSAQAAFIAGSDSFSTQGKITSDTGNVNTAMQYTFARIITSGGNGSGDFATYTSSDFSTLGTNDVLSLNFLVPNTSGTASFSYGSATYGTFSASTFTEQTTGTLTQAYYILGTFTPGTDFPAADQGISQPASLVVSFTQNGSSISVSGTLAVPPASVTVPEPASFGMVALALAGVAGVARLRRKAA